MITVSINSDSRYPVDRSSIRSVVRDVLSRYNITGDCEIDVSIVGRRKMTSLNQKYKGKDGATDVLSFPLMEGDDSQSSPDGVLRLGDVVVCYPIAVEYALKRQMLVDRVIGELVEHGCLHLVGVHHR